MPYSTVARESWFLAHEFEGWLRVLGQIGAMTSDEDAGRPRYVGRDHVRIERMPGLT